MKEPKVVFVVGPTASGKTELAVLLAKRLSSEVVSADSMQIYKGMHIASAAPDEKEMDGVPHSMVEFLPYDANFTVADYAGMARKEISRIIASGKTPVVAGGTGLYINALANNVKFLPAKTDMELRERLNAEYEASGGEAMLNKLKEIDPVAAEKLHLSDKHRIVRAFEIYETSGITKTRQNKLSTLNPPEFKPVMIGITYSDRQKLYDRINARVDSMINSGLLGEARRAFDSDVSGGATQAIGHKELFSYFAGEQSLGEAVESLKQATRRYAKRQLTWFNRDERINWICRDLTPDILGEAIKIIESEGISNA